MQINYNVSGENRKKLVGAISQELNLPMNYLGAPKFDYQVGGYIITKNGEVIGEDNVELVANLDILHGFKAVKPAETEDICIETNNEDWLTQGGAVFDELPITEREELGLGQERRDPVGEDGMQASDVPESFTYRAELSDPERPDRMEIFTAENDIVAYKEAREFCEGEVVLLELHQLDDDYEFVRGVDIQKLVEENNLYDTLTIEIPKNGTLSDTHFQNLIKLAESKRTLLAKAIGSPLEIKETGDNVQFVFPYSEEVGVGEIYGQLAAAMVRYVKRHQRVTATEREVESEKFAMRTFLVKIGMNGAEYSTARKWYSRNLSGNASFSANAKYTAMQESRRNVKESEVQGDE